MTYRVSEERLISTPHTHWYRLCSQQVCLPCRLKPEIAAAGGATHKVKTLDASHMVWQDAGHKAPAAHHLALSGR